MIFQNKEYSAFKNQYQQITEEIKNDLNLKGNNELKFKASNKHQSNGKRD